MVTTNDGPAVHVWDLRAIHRQLANMGLDWDAPAFSDVDPAGPSAPSLQPLRVDLPLPFTESIEPGFYEPVILDLEAALVNQPNQPSIRRRLVRLCNHFAWNLAKAAGSKGNLQRALALARRAVELSPNQACCLNTLGVVQYRAGRYTEAIATLDLSLAAGHGQTDGYDLFFQAMAHWQLRDKARALACFGKGVQWMEKNQQTNEEFNRFRARPRLC